MIVVSEPLVAFYVSLTIIFDVSHAMTRDPDRLQPCRGGAALYTDFEPI